jgi:hypothetical protein
MKLLVDKVLVYEMALEKMDFGKVESGHHNIVVNEMASR